MTARALATVLFAGATLLVLIVPFSIGSQDDDSKAIKAEVFIKQRPTKSAPSRARYRPAAKSSEPITSTPPNGMVTAEIGLTMWRYRTIAGRDRTKELVEEDDGQEWILERIAEGTPLAPGQKVRLSLESLSKIGFLYVINREEYADGTFGDPMLIFPTQKSIDSNKVEPGRLVYIPSTCGKFRIKPSESAKTHIGESLTIIISPKPLIDDRQLQPGAMKLQREQFDQWVNKSKPRTAKFEMEGGEGQTMTRAEKAAANLGSPLLAQSDPVPQTIYQLVVKPEEPLLIVLPLRFAR